MSAVAEFEPFFHKILKFTNLVNLVIGIKCLGHLETSIERSLHGTNGVQFHKNIAELFDVVNGKGNPYENIHDVQPRLHNLMTKTVVDKESRQKILNVLKIIKREYLLFSNEQSIEEVKSKIQKYLRLSHLLSALWETTTVNPLRVKRQLSVKTWN